MVNCLNSYIIYGKEFIQNSPDNAKILASMIEKAISLEPMSNNEGLNYSNNIEACVVLQMALQNLDGTSVFG